MAFNALTGAPLDGVKVSINANNKKVRDTVSDAQGGFRIEGLAPGQYSASFSKHGFGGPARDDASRRPFVVTGGGSPVRLEVRLTPLGKVAGRVLDSAGVPVAGAAVELIGGGIGYDGTTDREGKFSFDEVSPGGYRLWITPPKSLKAPPAKGEERMAWVPTFFPGVAEANAASRLVVREGQELWDQEVRLQTARVHRIRGVVLDAAGEPVAGLRVTLGSNQGGIAVKAEDRETHTVAAGDGSFEFPDVTDGIWRLSAEAENNGAKLRAFTAERMTGHDLDRVQLRLSPPFTVSGTVMREAPAGAAGKKAPMLVLLAPAGGGSVFHQAAPDAEDRFHIDGVYPGQYIVRPIQPGPPYYLASMKLGEREVPYGQPVEVASGALPLTVVYKSDGGSVRGTVEDCGSASVVFYPQDPNLRIPEFRRIATCGDRGRFEIANMRPGEYYGFAFDRAPGLEEMFLGFELDQALLNQAVRVTVRPGESTAADLRVTHRQ